MKQSFSPATPNHLPDKLSISFWYWAWVTSALPDEPYGDLEKCMVELKERGFNTIRVDAGLNWCFSHDGTPRGIMEFGPWIIGGSKPPRGGGRHDVLKRVLRLMELAKRHDVYVILTSWEYQDSTSFVADPKIRAEVYGIPEEERLLHLARHHDRLIRILKDNDLEKNIAFVEVHNEVDYSEFPKGSEGKRLHTEAIAFLRQAHPDILISGDFCGSRDAEIVPDNVQVCDKHMYAGVTMYHDGLYRQTVWHPDFDPDNPKKLKSLRLLLKNTIVPYDEFLKSAQNMREYWQPIMWLYDNLDNARFDQWMLDQLAERKTEIRDTAMKFFAIDADEAAKRNIPAVIDEGGYFCPPPASRWEESDQGMWLFEFMADLAIKHNYWGFMPTTYSGPDWPKWYEKPEWLKNINTRFQSGKLK